MQAQVKEFQAKGGLRLSPTSAVMDLTSEVGELNKALLKAIHYGKAEAIDPQLLTNLRDEAGDVYYSLLCVAIALDFDLERALQQTLEKYQNRLNSTGQIGSGR